jgi:transposase InsO family protein
MLRDLLAQEGFKMSQLYAATQMKRMGIEAMYRKPNTSKPPPGQRVYPYLLRKLPVTRPNKVWAMDTTYIAMARGFIYLATCWRRGRTEPAWTEKALGGAMSSLSASERLLRQAELS